MLNNSNRLSVPLQQLGEPSMIGIPATGHRHFTSNDLPVTSLRIRTRLVEPRLPRGAFKCESTAFILLTESWACTRHCIVVHARLPLFCWLSPPSSGVLRLPVPILVPTVTCQRAPLNIRPFQAAIICKNAKIL